MPEPRPNVTRRHARAERSDVLPAEKPQRHFRRARPAVPRRRRFTRSPPRCPPFSTSRSPRAIAGAARPCVHHGLEPGDIGRLRGLPVTTPLRTLDDLGWPIRLVREALARSLVRPEQLPSERSSENDFEERMRVLVTQAGLPRPVAQYRFGVSRLDFAWPGHGVAVETDGWATHGRRQAFEDDRARDAALAAAGWRTLRVTYCRLRREPTLVAAQLAAVLARAAAAWVSGPAQAAAPIASKSSVYSWPVASATGS